MSRRPSNSRAPEAHARRPSTQARARLVGRRPAATVRRLEEPHRPAVPVRPDFHWRVQVCAEAPLRPGAPSLTIRAGRASVDQRPRGGFMEIGIGLPNTLDMPGGAVVDWARRAEE